MDISSICGLLCLSCYDWPKVSERGNRQGCPGLSLLFALAIELLVEAIRSHLLITGIELCPVQHKISPYTDDFQP